MNLRRSIATVAVIALPLGLSGCGFDAPTDQVYTPAVGVNNQDGQVDVLNALIVSAEDGSGTLVVSLANNDQADPDALAGVAGQGAEVAVSGDVTIPEGGLVVLSDDSLTVTGDAVRAGAFVTLTFSFDEAASATVKAPVVAQDGPYADVPLP